VYQFYAWFESLVSVPKVCKYSVANGQQYLIDNGRGYFERPVTDAVKSEHYLRTRAFLAIDLAIAFALGLFIPSSWAFWVIPEWAIKVGAVLGMLVETFMDLIVSGNTDSRVGFLESIDESGKCFFKGEWMDDFQAEVGEFWKKEDYPPVGRRYIVLDYLGFFCSAPLDPATAAQN
jgi:hypothetical protein